MEQIKQIKMTDLQDCVKVINESFATVDNAAELHNLSVLPDCRHKGYGKRLLDYCERKAKEMGCNKIKIEIIEENKILKNWYLKNGFIHLFTKQFDYLPFTVGFLEKHL